jgi:phosphoheptose isomerase
VGISTSGNSRSVERALVEAKSKGWRSLLFSARTAAAIGGFENVFRSVVRSPKTSAIQQVHLMILHAWAQVIDEASGERQASSGPRSTR